MRVIKVTSTEAENCGMIYKVVADDVFETKQKDCCHTCINAYHGTRLYQTIVNMSFHTDYAEQLEERDVFQRAAITEDYQEGINVFLEKRQPVFKGKIIFMEDLSQYFLLRKDITYLNFGSFGACVKAGI